MRTLIVALLMVAGCAHVEPVLDAVVAVLDVVAPEPVPPTEPTCDLAAATLEEIAREETSLRSLIARAAPEERQVIFGQLLGLRLLRDNVLEWRAAHNCDPI